MSDTPTIAVVDDDEDVRSALTDLVEVLDMDCQAFNGAESFLAAHSVGRFGCLISDVKLDGASGLDLQARLRSIDPKMPVIILTAYSDRDTRARALAQGAAAFLTKPVNGKVLADQLEKAIRDTP